MNKILRDKIEKKEKIKKKIKKKIAIKRMSTIVDIKIK
jgi:hypothetical protein